MGHRGPPAAPPRQPRLRPPPSPSPSRPRAAHRAHPRVAPRRRAARARRASRRDLVRATATPTTRAAPAMGTATSRSGRATAVLALGVGLACAGCGSQARTRSAGGGSSVTAVAWLRATPPPASWPGLRIPSGAQLTYPPSWRRSHGDPGTATVVVRGADGDLLGYLNLTPRQGKETLADWSSFRPDHDRDEGDRSVRVLAAASGLTFPTGHGSCVKDAYTTQTGAHY